MGFMGDNQVRMTLLRGATLIDGTGAEPIQDCAVLINENRIEWVGPAAAAVVPPGTREIDVSGKTIMPGLIDCHDHMVHTGFDVMQRARSPLSLTMMKIADNLKV